MFVFGLGGTAVGDADVPRKSFTALPRRVPTFEPHVAMGLSGCDRAVFVDALPGGVGFEMEGTDVGGGDCSLVVGSDCDWELVAFSETTSAGGGGCLAGSSCLRGEVIGVGVVPANVATPVPLSSGVKEGEGGPALSPKISLMMETMSSSSSSAAVGLRAPLPMGFPRAHSRAVATSSAVSSPIWRPSLRESGSWRMHRYRKEGMRSFLSSSYVW